MPITFLIVVTLWQLQDAVTTAHETSDAFSDETLREQVIFQHAKEAEMKEMLGSFADGQIEFYKAVSPAFFVNIRRAASPKILGDGRVGSYHSYNTADSCGHLVYSSIVSHLVY